MEWGILVIVLILLFTSYVIIQETRAQMHWRGLVQQGDVDAIKALIEAEVEHWHTARTPKGTSSLLWHSIQTVELTDVNAKGARVSCTADGEYSLVNNQRIETSSPLTEGMKTTMKLSEMLLYDVPNVKLEYVQVDVFTSYRDMSGRADTLCILSTLVEREVVEHVDWEEMPAPEFIDLTDGRFHADASGTIQPVEPLPWDEGAMRSS